MYKLKMKLQSLVIDVKCLCLPVHWTLAIWKLIFI